MQINGREISFLGNNTWQVDGQHAVKAALGCDDLRVPATGEIVTVSADEASAIRAEREADKAHVAPRSRSPRPITQANLAYHMYSPNGRLFG